LTSSSDTVHSLTSEHRKHISEGQMRRHERVRQTRRVHLRTGDLDLREPDPALITVEEIAWGLAGTCRYSGKTPKHYSVAEHSCLVASHLRERGEPDEVLLAALLHDAHEAFVGDVLPCVKALVVGYRRIERDLDKAILTALALPLDLIEKHHTVVKQSDKWALSAEVKCLLKAEWSGVPVYEGPRLQLGLAAKAAERQFLKEYRRLTCPVK
jgi:uncharacterized protein